MERNNVRKSRILIVFFLFLASRSAWAGQEESKLIRDLWDSAYLKSGRACYTRTTVYEVQRGQQKYYVATTSLNLKVKRNNTPIELRMDTGTQETPEGKVVGVFMRQYLGKTKYLTILGQVKGKQLELKEIRGGQSRLIESAPWDDRVVGLYRQLSLFQNRKVKPGDEFSYLSFEPSINLVVKTNVKVKGYETVELFGGKIQKRLLRVEIKPEKIQNVQLPPLVSWLNDQYETVRSEVEVPGLGLLTLYKTTKSGALAPGSSADLTDVGISQLVPLKKGISNPYETREATYQIKIQGDDDPGSTFMEDSRQTVKNVQGQSFELHVQVSEENSSSEEAAGEEFLQSSYFINCKDFRVAKLARTAVGAEKDPWQKALRIEKWVNRNMKGRNHEALATSDHIAQTLEGDCTEYAMLMAAMCRAEGIPAQTTVGLIYAHIPGKGPCFSFHMWTEVWVKGQWKALDATLGRGYVGASHLKIAGHSWQDTRNLTPLLPVIRVLGKVSIEVIEAK